MKLFIDRTRVIKLAEGEACAAEMSKGQKAPGNALLFTWALIGTSPPGSTLRCSEEQATILATGDHPYFQSPIRSLFLLTPFRRGRKSPCLSSQCLRFHLLATMQTPRSAHIMPGNPTSSTGAEESGAVIHYTIFSIFYSSTVRIFAKDGALLRR